MDRKEILNFPLDKFLIPLYKIDLYVKPPPNAKQIISNIDKAYAYIGNRVGNRVGNSISRWNFKFGIHRHAPELKFHLGLVFPACLRPLQFKFFPRSLLLQRHHYKYSMQLLSNIMPTPVKKNLKLFSISRLSQEIRSDKILLRCHQ